MSYTPNIRFSGDVTSLNNVTIIGSNKVTDNMLSNVNSSTFKGRISTLSGSSENLTVSEATSMLNIFSGDTGSGSVKGLVPPTISGDSVKYLKGDGTWSTISSGGGSFSGGTVTGPTNFTNGLSATTISKIGGISSQILMADGSVATTTSLGLEKLYTNVKDFGAVGDGITDDYVAINNAIISLSSISGGTVYFPIGDYLINSGITINNSSNITFKGDNLNSKIIAKGFNGRHINFTDCDSIIFKDIRLIGDGMNSVNSVGGLIFQLSTKTNTAYHLFENVVIEEITNSAIVMDTPILCSFKNVLTRLVVGHGWDLWNGGTSVTLETCFALTCTQAGYMLDTMTYCSLNGCAADVCGVGYNFRNSKAISLLGCGSEASIFRNVIYDGSGWKLFNSSIVTAISCYERGSLIEFNIEVGSRLDKINFKSSATTHVTSIDTVQPTLISATNIKTINGDTLLGSGNLIITGGTGSGSSWGSISGTLSNQSDLQTVLNDKVFKTGDTITGNLIISGASNGVLEIVSGIDGSDGLILKFPSGTFNDSANILFKGNDGIFNINYAGIKGGVESWSNDHGYLGFKTAFSTSLTEKMRLTAYGSLEIGDTFLGNTGTLAYGLSIKGNTLLGKINDDGINKLQVSGNTILHGSLTTTTISASTYLNLPKDVFVTGGTYNSGTAVFTNNTGATFSVTGFSTGGGSSTLPSGVNTNVQFNNNGVFSGASNVNIIGDNLNLATVIGNPANPPTDSITMFGRKVAGRNLPAYISPSGFDSALQPFIARNKIAYWNPSGNATTVPGIFGLTAPTAVGTATARNVAVTNILTRMKRLGYVSSATAGSLTSQYIPNAQFTTGNGTVLGGYTYICRFGISDAATVSGARMFVGMSSTIAAPTNVEPSTLLNSAGVAQLSTDSTQLYFVHGGSATQATIPLGSANFPINNSNAYEIAIFSPTTLVSNYYWQVTNILTGVNVNGFVSGSTEIIVNTTLTTHRAWRTNNATALAVAFDMCSIYIETDQ